jgi:hypothetical protein
MAPATSGDQKPVLGEAWALQEIVAQVLVAILLSSALHIASVTALTMHCVRTKRHNRTKLSGIKCHNLQKMDVLLKKEKKVPKGLNV